MRVLQVHNRYRRLGGEDQVADLEVEQLRLAGHEVDRYLTHNPVSRRAAVRDLAMSPWNPFRAKDLAKYVSETKPDVVHVHNTWFHLTNATLRAIRQAGAPVVVTMHNYRSVCPSYSLMRDGAVCLTCVEKQSPWSGVRHGCYNNSRVLTLAPAMSIVVAKKKEVWHNDVDVIVVLTETAKEVLGRGGLPTDRMMVKPNFGVDPGERINQPSSSHRLMFVGRLTEEKGIRPLLEAWRRDRPEGLTLDVVGEGPLEHLLPADDPTVEFHGWLDQGEVLKRMLDARGLVFPSQWFEVFPLTLLEGMASGLPILSTKLGSMVAVLGDDHPLFSGLDASEIGDGLQAFSDGELVDSAGALGRQRFLENYTAETTLDRLLEIYEEAIRRRHQALF